MDKMEEGMCDDLPMSGTYDTGVVPSICGLFAIVIIVHWSAAHAHQPTSFVSGVSAADPIHKLVYIEIEAWRPGSHLRRWCHRDSHSHGFLHEPCPNVCIPVFPASVLLLKCDI